MSNNTTETQKIISLDATKLLGNTLKGTTMVGETKPSGRKPDPV